MGIVRAGNLETVGQSNAAKVDGSLKFNGSYLTKTWGSAPTSGTTQTFSYWVKFNEISPSVNRFPGIFGGQSSVDEAGFSYRGSGAAVLKFELNQGSNYIQTSQVFRDPSAWYHIVGVYNTSNATSTERLKLYINGVLVTALTSSYPNLNEGVGTLSNGYADYIGAYINGANAGYFHLSQFYGIDGQALDPSYFGYTDPLTNTWRPKKYTGTYGTNGFYLPLDGNTPIGQDQSGRGNNWTPVNFGGSNTIEKATGALPILNTDGGGKVARVGVRTDTNASSLVLALPLVGNANDISATIKGSGSNKTVTVTNAVSSVDSNFYGGSYYFDGTGDYLTLSANSDFNFGTGDFTIEAWVKVTIPLGNFRQTLCGQTDNVTGRYGVRLDNNGSGNFGFTYYSSVAGDYRNLISDLKVTSGVWSHIAVVRQSGVFKFFVNGVKASTDVSSYTTELVGNDSSAFYVARNVWDGSSYDAVQYVQDLRVYKGLAKYTQNFIPASTDPDILPDTPSGVAYSSNVTAITDGAVAFDGSGDYLSGASTSQFTTDAQYTIDGFVYIVSAPSSGSGVLIFDTGSGGNDPELNIYNNGGNLQLYESLSNNTNWNGGAPYMSVGRWYYFKQTVNGTSSTDSAATNKLYLNGQLGVSNTINLSARSASSIFAIGARTNGTVAFNGFISNLRYRNIVDDSLTVPTSLFDTDANTKLLCCRSNTSATAADVTPVTITANGNAAATNFNPFTTNINAVRGQESGYCTLNPLVTGQDTPSITNGNLDWTLTQGTILSTIGITSGKYYWEVTATTSNLAVGIALENVDKTLYIGYDSRAWGYYVDGSKYNNWPVTGTLSYGASYTTGDTIGIAFDATNGTLVFYKNGVSQGTAFTGLTSGPYFPAVGNGSSGGKCNFGQKPFKFPPPAGFQPLALANTPRPTIVRPDQYVGIVTYTGTSANPATITSDDFSFTPDFVWVKSRSNAESHALYDSVRGATYRLRSDTTGGETTGANELQSFIPGGFTAGNNGHIYFNNYTYAAWCWKAGGNKNTYNINDIGYSTASAAGLTAGTITPTGASVNTKSGFSIIRLTTSASSGTYTVSHGLGKEVAFFITKKINGTSQWWTYHKSIGQSGYLNLISTAGSATDYAWGANPTSSVITYTNDFLVGSSDYIIYAWAEIPGFSKFGSYTGNGSADGPMIVTGFKPAFVLLKTSSTSGNDWFIYDYKREAEYNPSTKPLYANGNYAEQGDSRPFDFLSNGFKVRNNLYINAGGATVIYAAFAEAPSFNLYGGQSNAR